MKNKSPVFISASLIAMLTLTILLPILYLKIWENNPLIQLEGQFAKITVDFIQNHLKNPFVIAIAYLNHKLETRLNIFVLLFFSIYIILSSKGRKKLMFLHLLYLIAFLEIGIYLNNKIFVEFLDFQRVSPNLALNLPTLPDMYNDPNLKRVSYTTFPGGHAFACFIWAFMYQPFLKNKGKTLFFIIATIISIPRALVGLHWISDIIFGMYLGYLYSHIAFKIPLARRYFIKNSHAT